MAEQLRPVSDEAGVWRRAGAGPAAAGAHALVVGISEYPFLNGGSQAFRVNDSHGLLQLQVSAKTAARIFAWLRKQGTIAGKPLQSCRLLLAPQRGAESDYVQRETDGHYGVPDFETLRRAVIEWGDEFLMAGAGSDSASLFFFSGHGLEHLSAPALLARDYLAPPGERGYRNAVGVRELREALRTFNVAASYYFIDACRNSTPELQRLTRGGQAILDPQSDPIVFPDPNSWIQATAPGQLAYQKNDPGAEATFFGQALLEGLSGRAPSYRPYDLASDPCALRFGELDLFVKERTRELLAEVNPQLTQSAKAGGDPYDEAALLIEVPRSAFPPPSPPPRPSTGTGRPPRDGGIGRLGPIIGFQSLGQSDETERDWWHSFPPSPPSSPPPPPPPPSPERTFKDQLARAESLVPAAVAIQGYVGSLSSLDLHPGLRHKWLSERWADSFRVGLDDLGDPRLKVSLKTVRTTETSSMICVWADLLVPGSNSPRPQWLLLGGRQTGWRKMGVLLPVSPSPLPIRAEAIFAKPERSTAELIQFSARIGPPDMLGPNDDNRSSWDILWQAQQREAFLHVAAARDALVPFAAGAEEALRRKAASPVAAALGAALLLQVGADSHLHDWPRNLADLYGSPDGAVLWAETLFRRGAKPGKPEWHEAMRYFATMGRRPPQLVPSLEIASARADWLRERSRRAAVTTEVRLALERLDEITLRLLPSGRFASFDAPDVSLASLWSGT
jgi:hypothetical protein